MSAQSLEEREHMNVLKDNMTVSEMTSRRGAWKKRIHLPGLGIAFTVLSCLFAAFGSVAVKLIDDVGGTMLSVSRFGVQILLLLPFVTYRRNDADVLGPRGLGKTLWMRGIFGSSALLTLYLSIKRMDVGDAVTISYTWTIMMPIFARIGLNETLTILEVILGFASLSGVVLIARPSFIFPSNTYDSVDELGLLYGLLGAICQAITMVLIRKLGKTDAAINILYFSVLGCATSCVIMTVSEEIRYPCYEDLLYFFSLGVIGIVGQYAMILGLRFERAATVGVARSMQVIFAYLLQILILKDIPSTLSLVGSGIIFLCCIVLGVSKVLKDRKNNGK